MTDGVFVFSTDGSDVYVATSLETAAGYLEAIDVRDGEYDAAYTIDGTVVEITAVVHDVVLRRIDRNEVAGLKARLRAHAAAAGTDANDPDPVSVANYLLKQQWQARWPRRPAWLARRLHGDGPPIVRYPKIT